MKLDATAALSLSTLYHPLGQPEPEGIFGLMVELLLKSRLKLHLDADRLYDEDVNAYLAGLLVSYIDPHYLHWIHRILARCDVDIHQAVVQSGEDRVRAYWIYKVNADDLLMSLGVFHPMSFPEPERRGAWCGDRRESPRGFPQPQPEEEAQGEVVRLRRYYTAASHCQKKMYRRPTAVADVQSKLADEPDRYLSILSNTRRDYFHFVQQISSEELNRLQKDS